MLFPSIYVGTGPILVLCTEYQLTCNCQTFNHAVNIFAFHLFSHNCSFDINIVKMPTT